jgi:hypothetical protein
MAEELKGEGHGCCINGWEDTRSHYFGEFIRGKDEVHGNGFLYSSCYSMTNRLRLTMDATRYPTVSMFQAYNNSDSLKLYSKDPVKQNEWPTISHPSRHAHSPKL